jgi:hypothetical protein
VKLTILIPMAAVLLLWGAAILSPPGPARAAQRLLLADRHTNGGIGCPDCHKESPPGRSVPMAVCLGCHGDYQKVAAKTGKIDPNPHASHLGEYECVKCHHAHKASVNACAECHPMDMDVP